MYLRKKTSSLPSVLIFINFELILTRAGSALGLPSAPAWCGHKTVCLWDISTFSVSVDVSSRSSKPKYNFGCKTRYYSSCFHHVIMTKVGGRGVVNAACTYMYDLIIWILKLTAMTRDVGLSKGRWVQVT